MRIALLSTPFIPVPPRDYGGTELVVHELACGLLDRGHQVVVFATGDSAVHAPVQALYERAQWPPDVLTDLNHVAWAWREIVRDDAFDIVHANSAAALACASLLDRSWPLVYTIHHAREQAYSAFYRWFPEVHYVAISHDQRRREVPLPSVDVIHHGLNPANYQQTDRLGEYVLFLGRLSPVKGVHTAIDVAAAARLPIVVGGRVHAEDAAWAARVLEWRLRQEHVIHQPHVSLAQKVPLLRDARALLAPIEWNEPFGLALIEAMLSGCPVIAFGHGSVPELVEPGVTGWIARDPEHMVDLLRPGAAVDRFDRARCRAVAVQRFGSERMVGQYEQLYRRLLDRPVTGERRRLHVA